MLDTSRDENLDDIEPDVPYSVGPSANTEDFNWSFLPGF